MQYVLTYRSVEDFYDLAMANYPAHLARLLDFRERGLLLMAGPFMDPMNGDSMAIFTTPEAVDEFMSQDPFVVNGVVDSHTIRPWDGELPPDAAQGQQSSDPVPHRRHGDATAQVDRARRSG